MKANLLMYSTTPWRPAYVNNGHECIIAEVFHPTDPLPNTPIFNVPTHPHVAQKNLSLVKYKKGLFHFSFEIHNAARTIRSFNIFAEEGKLEQLDKII